MIDARNALRSKPRSRRIHIGGKHRLYWFERAGPARALLAAHTRCKVNPPDNVPTKCMLRAAAF